MKQGIHPHYVETTIACACGSVIKTRDTKENVKIEICSSCHPFFTGKHKLIDTEGRVERFLNKYKKKVS
jgi:large subunit ribosomal protein L31